MELTLSNRLEFLFEALMTHLFERTSPFGKILVVVPSLAMKTWIMQQAALKHHIAFGFEVCLLNDAIYKISPPSSYLNPIQLAMRIEKEFQCDSELALELAELFLKYGEYYPEEMEEWARAPKHWQAELWQKIYKDATPLYKHLQKPIQQQPLQVHLFGFSYLSESKQKFFEKLNSLFYWVLSPSRMLWVDHKSKKEQYYLTSLLEEQGIKDTQIEELHTYLEESNPLIGNNGRLGRKWREGMEAISPVEIYGVAASASLDLMDGVYEYPSHQLTLLEAVQADLTLLVKREEPLQLDEKDRSIQIHMTPSIFREVEVLYETILQSGVEPKEIIVMAPSLENYIPFIKTVFSNLPFEILEKTSLAETPHFRLFFALLELPLSRWEIDPFFELLESPHFFCKIKGENLQILKTLLTEQKVRWGLSRDHREEVYQQPLIDSSDKGSWQGGLHKLVEGLIFEQGRLSNTQAELLSSLLDLLHQLQEDLAQCPLLALVDKYLLHEEERESIRELLRRLPESDLPFKSLLTYLKKMAEETPPILSAKNLQAVRFCPLLPMRAIPAKVIVVLGMNSEVFPRIERKNPWHLATSKTYVPSSTDFDRYLFLESFLSARSQWILSCQNTDAQGPSSLIQEVLHHLDAGYRIGERKPSDALVFAHSELPFDFRYFSENSDVKSSSFMGYKSALAYMKRKSSPLLELQAPLPAEALALERLPEHLTLKQLNQWLYHPIKYRLNHVLGIYLPQNYTHTHLEEFIGDRLWDSDWLKWSLKAPIDQVMELIEEKLPLEPFKQATKDRFQKTMGEWKTLLESREVFEIQFTYDCQKIEQTSPSTWRSPAVCVDYQGKRVFITGTLPYVSKEGLISLKDFKHDSFSPLLAELLLLREVNLTEGQVLFIKNNKTFSPQNISWQSLLEHYLRSLHQPLPHLPAWIPLIINQNKEKLQLAFEASDNPYLKWAFPSINFPKMIEDWQEITHSLFGDLYGNI